MEIDVTDMDRHIPNEVVNKKVVVSVLNMDRILQPMVVAMHNNEKIILNLKHMVQIRLLVTGKGQ